jgi:hypothetical protein
VGIESWDWDGSDERPGWERLLVGLRDGCFLGPEPGVRKRGLVSVNAGWLARGGLLRLRADRLDFEPNPLERLLGARRRTFRFDDIQWIERRPARPGDMSPTGQVARMRIHLEDDAHVDVLPAGDTLDDWLLALRESRAWWRRRDRAAADGGQETLAA